MKYRLIALMLALCLLSGCASPLVPSEYTVMSEHSDTLVETRSDAVSAETYDELKYAIIAFVEDGVTSGVIRSYRYDGDIKTDLTAAAYEVWKYDPMGAYAVEYIMTECDLLLSYYESRVEITYRDDAVPSDEIQYVRGKQGAEEAVVEALNATKNRVTLRISAYNDSFDCAAFIDSYCTANPETMIETPTVEVSVYPEEGSTRILDMRFGYAHTAMDLISMRMAVSSVLNSAVSYVRYRNEDTAKAEMLVSYLLGRFDYTEAASDVPVYALLCEGVADSATFAKIFQILCDRVGLNCQTVAGYLDGESYSWNILQIGATYHHVDLMRYVREGMTSLRYYADSDMERYSWDRERYPACGLPEITLENPVEEPEDETGTTDPETPPEPENPTVPEEPSEPESPEELVDPESVEPSENNGKPDTNS